MGDTLQAFFARAEQIGGIQAKVRLAELTKMPSTVAAVTEDSEALVARFTAALREVVEELGGDGELAPPSSRSRWDACLLLLDRRERYVGSRRDTAAHVNELATSLFRVARCSVWFLTDAGRALGCADVYDSTTATHDEGPSLHASECRPHLDALRTERNLAVSNARADPRTAPFLSSYIEPNEICAVLAAPIESRGELLGVFQAEHLTVRPWARDDRYYARFFGQVLALAEELREGTFASRGGA